MQFCRRADDVGRQLELLREEAVGVPRFNPERREGIFREILEVECQNDVGLAANRGGQHVAIVWVGQRKEGISDS